MGGSAGQSFLHVTLLTCGHFRSYTTKPKRGEDVYCVKCNKAVKVQVAGDNWHIKCYSCPYARHYGNSPLTARTMGAKHSTVKHHAVRIYSDSGVVEIAGKHHLPNVETEQLTLDTGSC